MKKFRASVALFVGILGCSSMVGAYAQGGDPAADKMFVMNATEGSMAEIAQSKIALKKSKNPDVKAYAQKMIDDHTKLIADMKPIADQMGVQPPTMLNPAHQQEEKRLMAMSGTQFDAEYTRAMLADHHKTLGMFKNEEATTSNQQLKDAIMQGEPVIQQHTDMIDQMAQKMNIPVPAMGM